MYADNDEFLVLPDLVKNIDQIIYYLDQHKFDTVQFHLLEMFSDQPFYNLKDETTWSFQEFENCYRFFDISTLEKRKSNMSSHEVLYGGVRRKHFHVDPFLTKYTFFKKIGPTNFKNSHQILKTAFTPTRKVSDFNLFVKHFKFNSRYYPNLVRAVRENSYHNFSVQLRSALVKLNQDGNYNLMSETALKYNNCEQIRKKQFVNYSERFQKFIRNYNN